MDVFEDIRNGSFFVSMAFMRLLKGLMCQVIKSKQKHRTTPLTMATHCSYIWLHIDHYLQTICTRRGDFAWQMVFIIQSDLIYRFNRLHTLAISILVGWFIRFCVSTPSSPMITARSIFFHLFAFSCRLRIVITNAFHPFEIQFKYFFCSPSLEYILESHSFLLEFA